MLDVSVISAMLGGFLTFFAPCTFPLIPGYLGFISGIQRDIGLEDCKRNTRAHYLFFNAVFFTFGFSVIFMIYGLASGMIGKFLILYKTEITQFGGMMIVLLGLFILNHATLPSFFSPRMAKLPRWILPGTRTGSFLLGVLFALGWSPCIGPILGTILLLATTSTTALHGAFLLSLYSLGIAIPFLFIAYVYGATFMYVGRIEKYVSIVSHIGAWMLIILGALLLFGQLNFIGALATDLFQKPFINWFFNYL